MKWSEIDDWLEYLSRLSGDASLKEAVLNRIVSQRDLHAVYEDETPLCRFCLIKMGVLFAGSEESERKLRDVLMDFDFDGAIIC